MLSSDVISSSAYATEQILLILVQAIGVAAFSLVVPITTAVIVVLAVVTMSYLEVIKVYTKAGGAYVVARENFGLGVAQIAAVALLIDYTLTVAVSVAAGVAALDLRLPVAHRRHGVDVDRLRPAHRLRQPARHPRGGPGLRRAHLLLHRQHGPAHRASVRIGPWSGQLHAHSLHQPGAVPIGHPGSGLFYGAALFVVLRAFASGGTALTGTEAISNGVSVFRQPEARNARQTLVIMSVILGTLVLGVSILAAIVHPVPRISGTPTVVSQIATYVYGTGTLRPPPVPGPAGRAPCSSWCWRPTPASPGSRSWPASPPRTRTCPASSTAAATGWCSRPA